MKYVLIMILFAALTLSAIARDSTCQSQPHTRQDKFLNEKFFHFRKNGVFVDIGAHDGCSYSNTYYFEKELNWTGICFEPLPEAFEKLKKNRNCICVNACVSDVDGEVQFLQVEDIVPHGAYPGYNHNMLSGMLHTYDPRHLQRLTTELGNAGGTYKIITRPSRILGNVLKEHSIKKIDYLSLDTEGGELLILKTINYDEIDIYAITVENNYNDPEVRVFLESKNFLFITHLGQDEVYIHAKSLDKVN